MAEETKKITELTTKTGTSANDVLVFVSNVAGNAVTSKITVANFLTNSLANVCIQLSTPANSTITVKQGTIFCDSDYLYIATANSVVKRISLSSF